MAEEIKNHDGGQPDNMFSFTLKKAARSVAEEKLRVHNKTSLGRVKHVGPKLIAVQDIQRFFFSDPNSATRPLIVLYGF